MAEHDYPLALRSFHYGHTFQLTSLLVNYVEATAVLRNQSLATVELSERRSIYRVPWLGACCTGSIHRGERGNAWQNTIPH